MIIDKMYEEYINFTPLSPRTKELYINAYSTFWKKEIGNLELENLDYSTIQSGINALLDRYSYNTVKVYKNSIFKFIEIAELKNNSFKFVGKHSVYCGQPTKKKSFNPYSLEEFYDLMLHIKKSRSKNAKQYEIALWIGFFTGMRIAEVFALKKTDVNLRKREIYITNSKTPNGVRTVFVCDELTDILREYIQKLNSDILLPNKNDDFITPQNLSSFIAHYAKRRNYTIHFHTLREMFVKTMIDNGANIESSRAILGHANTSTTLDLYLKTNIDETKKDVFNVYNHINFRKKLEEKNI